MKVIDWKFKEDIKVYTDDFWYDLTLGGYLVPEKILTDKEQINKLIDAIRTIESFEKAIEERMESEEENESDN